MSLEIYGKSRDALVEAMMETRGRALAPSPKMTLSEWADEHGRLSSESSAEPGPFRAYGYQRGLLDAMSDPASHTVAIMKSARVGYTQLATLALGYYTEHDPTSTLFVLPTEDDAKDFMKSAVTPMIRDTPVLAEITGTGEATDQWHTRYTNKGSVLRCRGAHSADTFRRITSRINIGDEIDGSAWASGGANSQGDKIKLLKKRGETYWNAKLIVGSTPTIKEQSRIEDYYETGDKRRYFVCCPHCGHEQILEWGGRESDHGVKWPEGKPHEAYYVCAGNGCVIEEEHKPQMIEDGEWHATAEGLPGVASFHISALYSLFPNAAWGKLAVEFVDAKGDRKKLQPFINLVLGESFEDTSAQGRTFAPHELEERVEPYQADVPLGCRFVTFGVDVQSGKQGSGGYFEASAYGWGAGEKGALIGHWVLDDEPLTSPAAWENLSELLARPFKGEDGRTYRAAAAAIDSGGHYTSEVYAFCDRNANRNFWAIKGRSNAKGERSRSIWPTAPKKGKGGGTVYSIDQDMAKDTMYRRIHGDQDAAGAIMWPAAELDGSVPVDSLFFKRLTRERPVAVQGKPGKFFWSSPSDNEPWDCLMYAYAATYGLRAAPGGIRFKQFLATPLKPRSAPTAQTEGAETPAAQQARPARTGRRPVARKSSFMKR